MSEPSISEIELQARTIVTLCERAIVSQKCVMTFEEHVSVRHCARSIIAASNDLEKRDVERARL